MLRTAIAVLIALAFAALAAWWFWPQPAAVPVAAAPASPARPATAPAPASEPGFAASAAPALVAASAPPEPAPATTALAADEVDAALVGLLGRETVLRWLQTDALARRVVATVDNLGRSFAPASVWPVLPTPGRFTTQTVQGRVTPAPANAQRYTAFVQLLQNTEPDAVAALYARMYPLLQQAYEELGYPRGRFNDRLFEVIDLLLATPLPQTPPTLTLVQVQGPIVPTRPWVRYEFEDPTLQRLASGQKLLLRVGNEHGRRIQDWLRALRAALQRAAPR